MNTSINNNINFTAKMNIKGASRNLSRWQGIAQKFESQTKTIPNGEISIMRYAEDCICSGYMKISLYSSNTPSSTSLDVRLNDLSAKSLENLSDSKIISTLKKLFKINNKNDRILKAYDNFCDELDKGILEENESKLSTMAYESITENTLNSLAKDKVTSDWEADWGFSDL